MCPASTSTVPRTRTRPRPIRPAFRCRPPTRTATTSPTRPATRCTRRTRTAPTCATPAPSRSGVLAYRKENGLAPSVKVPVDAVTASFSGLDPDISVANARLQAPRVAHARHTVGRLRARARLEVHRRARPRVHGRARGQRSRAQPRARPPVVSLSSRVHDFGTNGLGQRDRLLARLVGRETDTSRRLLGNEHEPPDREIAEPNGELDAEAVCPRRDARLARRQHDPPRLDPRQLRIERKRLEPARPQAEHLRPSFFEVASTTGSGDSNIGDLSQHWNPSSGSTSGRLATMSALTHLLPRRARRRSRGSARSEFPCRAR